MRVRRWSSWFFTDPVRGRVVIAQAPNAAIDVFIVATILRWTPYDRVDAELRWVGAGALLVWGLDEVLRGVSPFRRVLGAIVLGWQLFGLLG